MRSRALLVFTLLACSSPALAGVYKCEKDGRPVYSDLPCPKAKPVDLTNGRAPDRADMYSAQARALRDQAAIADKAAQEARDRKQSKECDKILRDHNWTVATAAKYPDDQWWKNQVTDSTDNLNKRCGKFLIPGGIGY
jgi:hypothetical protein